MFSCNLRFRLIFLHGCSRTHCVASLRAVPVGRISYNLYFDCKHVRSVTCDLINEYTYTATRVRPFAQYEVIQVKFPPHISEYRLAH